MSTENETMDAFKVNDLIKFFSQVERQGIGFDATTGINTNNSFAAYSRPLKKYDLDTVNTWLEQPAKYESNLRNLSLYLMNSNTLYYRVIHYMASMPQLCPVLMPLNIKENTQKLKENYFKTATYLQDLNLSHEFVKVFISLFSEAVFFGIECKSKDSYYIKKLNPDYCQITAVLDGAYCFHFDLSFFDNDKTGELLDSYDEILPIFKDAYAQYKKNKVLKWVEIPAEDSVCFRMDEGSEYNIPPFVSSFNDLVSIESYKALNLISTEQSNYQLLGLEMETNSKSDKANDFKVSTDVVMAFYNMISAGLPSGVGSFVTPVKATPIRFEKRQGEIDQVANATEALYQSLGLSSVLFAGASNAGTLKYSTRVDEGMIFALYRQIERWINRKLKINHMDFTVSLMDVTLFSREDVRASYLTLAQMSIPVKSHLAACSGLSPLELITSSYLENEIIDFDSNWKPLSSTHTQTKSETGRKEKAEDELSESGQKTRDEDLNASRERKI